MLILLQLVTLRTGRTSSPKDCLVSKGNNKGILQITSLETTVLIHSSIIPFSYSANPMEEKVWLHKHK